jgi:purine nucleosidase
VTRRILVDCDPGIDDAIALLLAVGNPDVELVAITTVAGNQTLEKVTYNARRIATIAGINGVPVVAGCDRPLVREPINAGEVHGESGLDGPVPFEPTVPLSEGHAVDLIIETVLASPDEITLVPIGPLTNIAAALRREPGIAGAVREVVLMGGAYTRGNTTPAAEFNILADPEAAAVVFSADWPVTMVGLDLTHQARATPDVVARIEQIGTPVSRFVLDLLGHYGRTTAGEGTGAAIHDACAVAYVIDPTLMTTEQAYVAVELRGELTYGMTVTDFGGTGTTVPTVLDQDRFWSLVLDGLSRAGDAAQS